MGSGGARTRSGPPPDPQAFRRDKEGEWLTLPAEGRTGEPPEWPLPKANAREKVLWAESWAMPQAVAWEAQQMHREVALYVRNFAIAEKPNSPVNRSTLVRQFADALGLTLPGLARNRWKIGQVAPVAQRPQRASARDRLRVVGD